MVTASSSAKRAAEAGTATGGGELPLETAPETKYKLDGPVPLPKSILWKHLRAYYDEAAIEAWVENTVPSFVTSNARLAASYASCILDFIRDLSALASKGAKQSTHLFPVRIVEVGAGHGKFTYLVLKELLRSRPRWQAMGLPEKPFMYICTDVAESNLAFVEQHYQLKEFVNMGFLEFSLFDANSADAEPVLRGCGKSMSFGSPVVAICNYVLDSLLTDGFQKRDGKLYRACATMYSTQQESDPASAAVIPRSTIQWEYDAYDISLGKSAKESLPAHPLLTNVNVQKVLQEYLNMSSSDLSFVLPLGAFVLVNTLRRLSGDRLLMLIGDKAFNDPHDFQGCRHPHIAIHGSLSFMLNLHAVRNFFDAIGGSSIGTPYKDTFQVTALWSVARSNPREDFPATYDSFSRNLANIPPDGLISWKSTLAQSINGGATASLKDMLLLVRHSCHEPEVFIAFSGEIRNAVAPIASAKTRYADLCYDLERVYENWYDLRNSEDVAERIAMIYMRMSELEEAVRFFEISLKRPKTRPALNSLVNLANCYKALGRIQESRKTVEQALAQDPSYEPARDLSVKLESCEHPTSIALVGSGVFSCYEQAPLLSRDSRFRIKAVYAFTEEEARELLKECLGDDGEDKKSTASSDSSAVASSRPQIQVYHGQQGFSDLLKRDDIDACVVDIHQVILPTFLQKLWTVGKHTLTVSPFAFKALAAHELSYKIRSSVPNAWDYIAWSAAEPFRQEEAFASARERLAPLGPVSAVQVIASYGRMSRPWHSYYGTKETLALELTHLFVVVKGIFRAEPCFDTVYASYHTFGDETSPAGKKSVRLAGGLNKEKGSLSGMATILRDGGGRTPLTFLLSGPCLESSTQLNFLCKRGELQIAISGAAWTMRSRTSHGVSEATILTTGNQSSHDAWLHHIRMKTQIKKGLREKPKTCYIEKSVFQAQADSALMDGVLESCSKKEGPSLINWLFKNQSPSHSSAGSSSPLSELSSIAAQQQQPQSPNFAQQQGTMSPSPSPAQTRGATTATGIPRGISNASNTSDSNASGAAQPKKNPSQLGSASVSPSSGKRVSSPAVASRGRQMKSTSPRAGGSPQRLHTPNSSAG